MKKLILLVIGLTMVLSGCAREEVDNNQVVGASWKTWGPYEEIEWSTPEGKETICARFMEEPAGFIFNKDADSYIEICKIEFHSKEVGDYALIMDSVKSEDVNGDGYGDIIVRDKESEGIFENIFLWNEDKQIFEYYDEGSEYIEESENAE